MEGDASPLAQRLVGAIGDERVSDGVAGHAVNDLFVDELLPHQHVEGLAERRILAVEQPVGLDGRRGCAQHLDDTPRLLVEDVETFT